ncbi:CoA pyrophosphatase [Streptacidiphilus sp. EB129]|uniref:NUDIX hydrolase n=1 Tax=Streptacidiphilus sp. EB129 TaxID=3156262 RepID=UPI0035119918
MTAAEQGTESGTAAGGESASAGDTANAGATGGEAGAGHAAGGAAAARAARGAAGAGQIRRDGLPSWLLPIRDAAERLEPQQLSRFLPPAEGGRRSAVLVLFGEATADQTGTDQTGTAHAGTGHAGDRVPAQAGDGVPDLLLIERARSLRSHAGQPSFPGGALDPEDGDPSGAGPVNAALREAWEETGLDPAGVQVFGVLPDLYIPVSNFVVTPVLGWWHTPSPVGPGDPAEVAAVFRVPLAELADPERRAKLRHPSGFRGPAFLVEGRLVWGFTAGVIDRILHHSGLEQPWDTSRVIEFSDEAALLAGNDPRRS